jgi:hypothetical protein
VGLGVALAGPALVPVLAAAVPGGAVAESVAGQLLLLALLGACLAIVLGWEQ